MINLNESRVATASSVVPLAVRQLPVTAPSTFDSELILPELFLLQKYQPLSPSMEDFIVFIFLPAELNSSIVISSIHNLPLLPMF